MIDVSEFMQVRGRTASTLTDDSRTEELSPQLGTQGASTNIVVPISNPLESNPLENNPLESPDDVVTNNVFSGMVLQPPTVKEQEKDLLPKWTGNVGTLSPIHSGMGELVIKNVGGSDLTVFAETVDGVQKVFQSVKDSDSFWNVGSNGVLFSLNGVKSYRRFLVAVKGSGVLTVGSSVFDFESKSQFRNDNGGFTVVMCFYNVFGKIVLHNSYWGYRDLSSVAAGNGFGKIFWTDPNTKL